MKKPTRWNWVRHWLVCPREIVGYRRLRRGRNRCRICGAKLEPLVSFGKQKKRGQRGRKR